MARFPRTLADQLLVQSQTARASRTYEIKAESEIAQRVEDEAADRGAALEDVGSALDGMTSELSGLAGSLDALDTSLRADMAQVETNLEGQINDAAASLVTDARIEPGSLTIWPFIQNVIPAGSFAPGAVGSTDIKDFSVAVTKLKSTRHHLY